MDQQHLHNCTAGLTHLTEHVACSSTSPWFYWIVSMSPAAFMSANPLRKIHEILKGCSVRESSFFDRVEVLSMNVTTLNFSFFPVAWFLPMSCSWSGSSTFLSKLCCTITSISFIVFSIKVKCKCLQTTSKWQQQHQANKYFPWLEKVAVWFQRYSETCKTTTDRNWHRTT